MKKVFLITDDSDWTELFRSCLHEERYIVEVVNTLPPLTNSQSLYALIARAQDFDVVVWDAVICVPGKHFFTAEGYIQEFAKMFKKPMIANGLDEELRREQLIAGCTHTVPEKGPYALLELLKQIGI